MNKDSLNRAMVNPVNLGISRSKFDRSYSYSTTFDTGRLIPFYLEEILPGDTFIADTSLVCRMTTPIFPVMDNAFLDVYYFYVPKRLVWKYTKEFMGENTTGAWTQTHEYLMPLVPAGDINNKSGSVADYLGLPLGQINADINILPFRCYGLIWNEWFRDQNTQAPIYIKTDGDGGINIDQDDFISDCFLGKPLRVNKFHDLFTSCLPDSQKHSPVLMPISGDGKLFTKPYGTDRYNLNHAAMISNLHGGDNGTLMYSTNTDTTIKSSQTNLFTSFENAALTVNQVREAFAIQRLFERDAMGGSRYREIIKSHYNVDILDNTCLIPEFLGGSRTPITVNQVVQTSSTDSTSPQGNTAAFSLTTDNNNGFTKSFTEPGYVLGVFCVRTNHTYSQNVEKLWTKARRFDEYYPALSNIGNVPVYKREIYSDGVHDSEVFGFQEAHYEYRFKNNMVTGLFRPSLGSSGLSAWNYADAFTASPTLNSEFMYETDNNVKRTLAVQNQPQFLINMYIKNIAYRPLPVYSTPGLIDHN